MGIVFVILGCLALVSAASAALLLAFWYKNPPGPPHGGCM